MTRARDRIAVATAALIEAEGFESITIAAVARAAGVSRQTVYAAFKDRESLVSEVVAGVALEAMVEVVAVLRPGGPAEVYLADFAVGARREIRARPVLAALLRPREGNPLFDDGALDRAWPIAQELLRPLFDHHPHLRPEDRSDPFLELVIRIGISAILFDGSATAADADLRRSLLRWFRDALPSPSD